jgi:hypothetical protein
MIIEVSQNEQNENGSVDDILAKEIESWNDYALREEDAPLFDKCFLNVDIIKTTSELLAAKVRAIQLNRYSCSVLQQQKMINELIAKVSIVNCTF